MARSEVVKRMWAISKERELLVSNECMMYILLLKTYTAPCLSSDVLIFPTVRFGVSPMVSQLSSFDGDIFSTFLAHVPTVFSLVQL